MHISNLKIVFVQIYFYGLCWGTYIFIFLYFKRYSYNIIKNKYEFFIRQYFHVYVSFQYVEHKSHYYITNQTYNFLFRQKRKKKMEFYSTIEIIFNGFGVEILGYKKLVCQSIIYYHQNVKYNAYDYKLSIFLQDILNIY